jgi:hypothetical protein
MRRLHFTPQVAKNAAGGLARGGSPTGAGGVAAGDGSSTGAGGAIGEGSGAGGGADGGRPVSGVTGTLPPAAVVERDTPSTALAPVVALSCP